MKATMRIDDALTAKLAALPNAVERRVRVAALLDAAEPIRRHASELAPRDRESTGPHLADHIIAAVPSQAKSIDLVGSERAEVVEIGPQAKFFYGRFQELATEYGGVRHGAQPFMRPAFDAQQQGALRILSDRLWTAITRIARRTFTRQATQTGTSRGRSGGVGL